MHIGAYCLFNIPKFISYETYRLFEIQTLLRFGRRPPRADRGLAQGARKLPARAAGRRRGRGPRTARIQIRRTRRTLGRRVRGPQDDPRTARRTGRGHRSVLLFIP